MKKRIIVSDDNDDTLYLMVTILQNAGYEVIGLNNGISIMEGLYGHPDLFILDNEMEPYDGIAIGKFLKSTADASSVPVMMVSGNHASQEAATAAGIDLFLTKPVNTQLLISSVSKLINAQQVS
jgi:CheY-like chemotaxis protein